MKKFQQYGKVYINDYVYIERKEDKEVLDLLKDFSLVTLNAPRQSGKTSLSGFINNELENANWFIFDITFVISTIENSNIFETIYADIRSKLNSELKQKFNNFKKELKNNGVPDNNILNSIISEFLKENIKQNLLFIFDEIDNIFCYGESGKRFLSEIKKLYENRFNLKISFLFIGINKLSSIFHDNFRETVNIESNIRLKDFDIKDEKTISTINENLDFIDKNLANDISKEILLYTGGQPFLTSFISNEINDLSHKINSIDSFKTLLHTEITEKLLKKNEHFDKFQIALDQRKDISFQILEIFKIILEKKTYILSKNDELKDNNKLYLEFLENIGVIKINNHIVEISSPIYAKYFDKNWILSQYKTLGDKNYVESPKKIIKNKKILAINMGGTIGMIPKIFEGKEIVTSVLTDEEFASIFKEANKNYNIAFKNLKPTDGANITPAHWVDISDVIYANYKIYDAFIITHGTDTMTYTASAVAFSMGANLSKPIIFVGAQVTNNIIYGDAQVNFYRVCELAQNEIPEVMICFNNKIFRAVRTEKQNDYEFDAFYSPAYNPLAVFYETLEINNNLIRKNYSENEIDFNNSFDNNILQITQYPSLKPHIFENLIFSNNISALIIQSLGVGNLTNEF